MKRSIVRSRSISAAQPWSTYLAHKCHPNLRRALRNRCTILWAAFQHIQWITAQLAHLKVVGQVPSFRLLVEASSSATPKQWVSLGRAWLGLRGRCIGVRRRWDRIGGWSHSCLLCRWWSKSRVTNRYVIKYDNGDTAGRPGKLCVSLRWRSFNTKWFYISRCSCSASTSGK